MARHVLSDYLQDFPFWLFDVPTMDTLATPIFAPLSGFSAVTAPEVTLEHESISEGNWFYKHHVIKRAEVNTLTLTRGVTLHNSDFYRWTVNALISTPFASLPVASSTIQFGPGITGGVTPRRNLVLVHFFGHAPVDVDPLSGLSGVLDFALRVPARAYLLVGCIPVRYKVGSDFDASSGAVSLSEMDVSYEYFEQFSL